MDGTTNARARHRLLRYDVRIAIHTLRHTLSGWGDRLIATMLLFVALVAVRSVGDVMAGWMGLAGGALVGLGAARGIGRRLAFHGAEGPLAFDALDRRGRRDYVIAAHLLAIAGWAAVTIVARPALLIVALPGYLGGAMLRHVVPDRRGAGVIGRASRQLWTQRPVMGALGAMSVLLTLWFSPAGSAPIVAGGGAAVVMLVLTPVDHAVVRFASLAGYSAWRTVAHLARCGIVFAIVAVPVSGLLFGPVVAGIVAAAAVAGLSLLALRVLTYRLHGKRMADLLVSVFAALLMWAALAFPVVLPLLAAALLWHLHRRAAAQTWLLA